jgi:hypothetical protein
MDDSRMKNPQVVDYLGVFKPSWTSMDLAGRVNGAGVT